MTSKAREMVAVLSFIEICSDCFAYSAWDQALATKKPLYKYCVYKQLIKRIRRVCKRYFLYQNNNTFISCSYRQLQHWLLSCVNGHKNQQFLYHSSAVPCEIWTYPMSQRVLLTFSILLIHQRHYICYIYTHVRFFVFL